MTREPLSFVLESVFPGQRLDAFLRERLPDVSRGTIQRLIESGQIRVNGRHAKVTQTPRVGDRIDVTWPEPRPAEACAQELPLEVLHEDADVLVLNKAPGVVVHPAVGHDDGTLVNALLHHCAGQLSGIGGVARPGIVHRLDKDTSGCLVVAKHDAAHLALAEQFAERETLKVYQTILCGQVRPPEGEIQAGIARHPNHRKRMAVTSGGRSARTEYRLLESFAEASWVEATIHTGRTHQIRVHFQFLGFPVVGDDIYGKKPNARLEEVTGFHAPRQMLHAWKLGFTHPTTRKELVFEAPLPVDFREALTVLRGAPKR